MPIDYRRLADGLGEVAAHTGSGSELMAVEGLVTAVREAVGAAGGTFTEYSPEGGRVVVAQGGMAWALGQPVPPQLATPDLIGHEFSGWIATMPPEAAQPLFAR